MAAWFELGETGCWRTAMHPDGQIEPDVAHKRIGEQASTMVPTIRNGRHLSLSGLLTGADGDAFLRRFFSLCMNQVFLVLWMSLLLDFASLLDIDTNSKSNLTDRIHHTTRENGLDLKPC